MFPQRGNQAAQTGHKAYPKGLPMNSKDRVVNWLLLDVARAALERAEALIPIVRADANTGVTPEDAARARLSRNAALEPLRQAVRNAQLATI
jgi:hypothetical protein